MVTDLDLDLVGIYFWKRPPFLLLFLFSVWYVIVYMFAYTRKQWEQEWTQITFPKNVLCNCSMVWTIHSLNHSDHTVEAQRKVERQVKVLIKIWLFSCYFPARSFCRYHSKFWGSVFGPLIIRKHVYNCSRIYSQQLITYCTVHVGVRTCTMYTVYI